MNILLINHYAGSLRHGMEYRPFYLAREWVRLGHAVTIAAASCSHVRTIAPQTNGSITEEEIDGIRYLWFRTPGYRHNGAKRAINMLAFTARLLRHRKRLESYCRSGAVIASSTYPLDAFPAHRIAGAAGARFIFEVHDLWPLSPIELGGMSPRHPFIILLQRAENFAYEHANKVVSILPKAEQHMLRHGLRPGKFVHIPNGIDASEWLTGGDRLPPDHQRAFDLARRNGHSVVLYAGAHGVANALDSVLGAAQVLQTSPVTIFLVGQGPEKPRLERLASERGLANVVFLDAVRKSAMPALLAAADILLITLQRSSLFRFGISPNKLIDYMMAGKPIIQAIDAGNDMVSDCRCGISVPPENPTAMADAIVHLAALTQDDRGAMGDRAKAYVLAHHDYPALARRFLDVLGSSPVSADPVEQPAGRSVQI